MTQRQLNCKILRRWYSVLSAHPEITTPAAVKLTANLCGVSTTAVFQAMRDDLS